MNKLIEDSYNIIRDRYIRCFTKETFDYIKDNAIIYDVETGQFLGNSLSSELLNETYNRMKQLNKSFILIIDKSEANWGHFKYQDTIHELCEQTGVPADKVVFVTNDINCDETYNKWFKRQTKYKIKMTFIGYPANIFERNFEVYDLEENYGFSFKIEKYKDREKLPTKKFICLMGHMNKQRKFLWEFFRQNQDIKKAGYISMLSEGVVLPNSSTHTDEQLCEYLWSSPLNDRLQPYHTDSYFSIVPEGESGFAFSEKIHKPLLHGHPFILLSCNTIVDHLDIMEVGVGMLDKLREWGFETFPELFDESYDEIDDFEKRNNNIKQQIIKLCNMETKELHKLSVSVEEKCIHNQKILLSLEIPNKQLVSKLENLKNG